MLREVKSPQRLQRELDLALTVTAGVPALTEGKFLATVTDNGVGDYSFTFVNPFTRAPTVQVSTRAASRIAYVSASSTTACTVKVTNLSAVATDDNVYIKVIGWDTADQA